MRNWNGPYPKKNVSYDKSWPEKVAETPFAGQANVHQEVPIGVMKVIVDSNPSDPELSYIFLVQ